MKKKLLVMLVCLLLSVLSGACSSTVQKVEVTRVVLQTAVVTQVVTKIITTTPLPTNTSVVSATPVPTDAPAPTPAIDMSPQDGKVVVVQYYTLLGLHLYEQAYQMLSAQIRQRAEKNTYLDGVKYAFIVVKVFHISPAIDEFSKYGGVPPDDIDDWYYVKIYAEGENGMSGSQVNGFQKLYVRLALENGVWKIADIGSSVH
jgi:hypothetical protein